MKDWQSLHRYSTLDSVRFSLFLLKKRAFKVFTKEAKQDFYSIKKLLNQSFVYLNSKDQNEKTLNDPLNFISFNQHKFFWSNYSKSSPKLKNLDFPNFFNKRCYFCIHCGISMN